MKGGKGQKKNGGKGQKKGGQKKGQKKERSDCNILTGSL